MKRRQEKEKEEEHVVCLWGFGLVGGNKEKRGAFVCVCVIEGIFAFLKKFIEALRDVSKLALSSPQSTQFAFLIYFSVCFFTFCFELRLDLRGKIKNKLLTWQGESSIFKRAITV